MSQFPGTQICPQRFTVAFDYPVVFTRDALHADNHALLDVLRRREPERLHRLFFVVDGGVWDAHPQLGEQIAGYCAAHAAHLSLAAPPFVSPGGEASKQGPALVDALHERLHAHGIDRHAYVVILGGGAVLDAAGYAAATAHRGVRVVRMPTTVLAQNDAGLGVKNGINAFGAKNFVGTFAPPFAVVNDASFLRTLSDRDKRAGLAEAVKVALIRDAAFFAFLREQAPALARFESSALETSIQRAAAIHLQHITQGGDPFELGSARPLDYGHWAAHKLESLSAHRVRHGEAVAIGMALDTRYAMLRGHLRDDEARAVLELLEALGFRLWDAALEQLDAAGRPAVLRGLSDFREHLGGELTVTLLAGIGRTLDVHDMDEPSVLQALSLLRARDQERCA